MTIRVLNYGLGTNSTALAIEATNRGIRFDIIIAADTGDERKRSYQYAREVFEPWLVAHGQPEITWVKWIRQDGSFIPISQLSLLRRELPAKAYGLSGCTVKWKQQPIDNYLKQHPLIAGLAGRGEVIATYRRARGRGSKRKVNTLALRAPAERVERWIGYDVDEPSRSERMLAKDPQPVRRIPVTTIDGELIYDLVDGKRKRRSREVKIPTWAWKCPLVDWDMGREECVDVIRAAGLQLPGKSSCFMCPSMKKHEILQMSRDEPEEMARALAIEDAARAGGNLVTVKGLGRSFSWREFLEGQSDATAAREVVDQECGCFDGDQS